MKTQARYRTRAGWKSDRDRAREIGGRIAAAMTAAREKREREARSRDETLTLPWDGAPIHDEREHPL